MSDHTGPQTILFARGFVMSCVTAAPFRFVQVILLMSMLVSTPCGGQETSKTDPATEKAVEKLAPLLQQLRDAKSTRATVELSAETIVDGAVISSEKSTYQVASGLPGKFTIYLKDEKQRSRIFCDGKQTVIAFSPTAYTDGGEPIALQQAVFDLPIALGPYPEAILSLTLAGIDPGLTWTEGMKSIRVVGNESFRGQTPAVHLEGLQDDLVRWNLWMSRESPPKPLRLRVDLTEMLRENGALELPKSYRYMLRFDFKYWAVDQPASDALFQFRKTSGAKRFESVEAYLNRDQ
ncbi:MAG: DUF2092 domain-containing protein [Planctomycetota bacterium]